MCGGNEEEIEWYSKDCFVFRMREALFSLNFADCQVSQSKEKEIVVELSDKDLLCQCGN